MREVKPEILIVSNKHDFATDHISFQLKQLGASYLRLNRDQFSDFTIGFVPTDPRLYGRTKNLTFEVTPNTLKSVYFRAPVYLRDTYQPNLSPDEQLQHSQWAAFVRGLTVFENALWVNHPHATYIAEIKPFQLYLAKKIGFDVPDTVITNCITDARSVVGKTSEMVMKTLDPVLLRVGDRDAFIYTNLIASAELLEADISTSPAVFQEALTPKTDIRVTVIRQSVFAVEITQDGRGVEGDWRLQKNSVQYTPIHLPPEIHEKCVRLLRELGLEFGAIDLAHSRSKYYFLEINPTGEWAWLIDQANLEIDRRIAEVLLGSD
jgi:hypothetical protein